MKKSILNLKGVQELTKAEQKTVLGKEGIVCPGNYCLWNGKKCVCYGMQPPVPPREQ